MKWLAILVSLPLALSACSDPEPTPEQTRAAEDRAIAAVEAAQDVPPNPVTLEPITFRDIDEHGLSGAGCAFRAETQGNGWIALALERGALIKIEGLAAVGTPVHLYRFNYCTPLRRLQPVATLCAPLRRCGSPALGPGLGQGSSRTLRARPSPTTTRPSGGAATRTR